MRYYFTSVPLLCCTLLFSSVLFVGGPASPAHALPTNTSSQKAVVEEAYGWIGTPYGAYGADCSGFASEVFAQFGVYLPDNPAAQWSYGVPSTAEAGDLVFYDEHGYGISHVGIATGYGTVIHSSTYYGAVVESPIYAIPGYVGARDVL
jgi:cell wall-associated NlpC family hydrolase